MDSSLANARLSAPVGPQQSNKPSDVVTVQKLINNLVDSSCLNVQSRLSETGSYDQATDAAIRSLESQYFHGMANPFHRVEPDAELFAFLQAAAKATNLVCPVGMLSSEMYHLAAIMVPGGVDKLVRGHHGNAGHHAVPGNIRTYLPHILSALKAKRIDDVDMLLMALATIRAETAAFAPISEGISHFNTSAKGTPGRHPFDKYDRPHSRLAGKLGNLGPPDGADYKGRGFVQLTGRDNYDRIGRQIGLGTSLLSNPEQANDPKIAALILAQFLFNNTNAIRVALKSGNYRSARRLVNGGPHGINEFEKAFKKGRKFIAQSAIARLGRQWKLGGHN